ncbi:GIY-YIG nuclease family protein [Flavobacterium acetivorans]|uniref:GIY-YIG nuclease family protein n=1 Tax=Flavobacterium acetivorans TaxID=2893883 RepID=UPI001E394CC5|nr:GIY-YIG nuclease family protein [Flavobacterium sp. F-29]UFH36198.1 GIY-YIG nuclease family protein [Flavobacterium sp. F-29]
MSGFFCLYLNMGHFVYILFSEKLDSYYVGETSNLHNRLKWHNEKEFSKAYSKITDDWAIFYQIDCNDISQARKIEKHIKAMKSRIYFQNLKMHSEISEKLLEKYT